MSHVAPPAARLPWWRKLLALEPAVVRVTVGAIVAALLVWGVDLTDLGERIADTADIIGGTLVPALTAWWVRAGSTPTVTVLEAARRDVDGVWVVQAGPANDLIPTGEVIRQMGPVAHLNEPSWPAHDDRA